MLSYDEINLGARNMDTTVVHTGEHKNLTSESNYHHLYSEPEIYYDNLCGSQLLIGGDTSHDDPMVRVACGVGSAHKRY